MPPKPELSSAQRRMVVSQLLARSKGEEENNKLKRGALTEVANLFAVNPRTIARIWKRARLSFEDPDIGAFRASPRKDRGGRMQQHDRDAIREAILLVPMHQRRTLRTLASAIGIPLSTLHSLKQDKVVDASFVEAGQNGLGDPFPLKRLETASARPPQVREGTLRSS